MAFDSWSDCVVLGKNVEHPVMKKRPHKDHGEPKPNKPEFKKPRISVQPSKANKQATEDKSGKFNESESVESEESCDEGSKLPDRAACYVWMHPTWERVNPKTFKLSDTLPAPHPDESIYFMDGYTPRQVALNTAWRLRGEVFELGRRAMTNDMRLALEDWIMEHDFKVQHVVVHGGAPSGELTKLFQLLKPKSVRVA